MKIHMLYYANCEESQCHKGSRWLMRQGQIVSLIEGVQ